MVQIRQRMMVLTCVLAAVVAACSYDNRPADDPTRLDEAPSDCGAIKGWSFVQGTVLSRCAGVGCHDAGNERGTVVLTPTSAYTSTVGINSQALPSMKLIEPGRPSRSFFFRKLSNTQAAACVGDAVPGAQCGNPMPLNDWSGIPPEWVEETRAWIACGAPK